MLLVVAATPRELEGAGAEATLACGIGPVEAAVRTAAALAERRPRALLQVGIAGVRRGCGIALLDAVIGTESLYCDADLARPLLPDPGLLEAARRALPEAHAEPIGTSGRVGDSHTARVEAMEGYGVLRAAQLAGVPALELRVVSNEIEEADRSRWLFEEAFDRLAAATAAVVAALRARGAA